MHFRNEQHARIRARVVDLPRSRARRLARAAVPVLAATMFGVSGVAGGAMPAGAAPMPYSACPQGGTITSVASPAAGANLAATSIVATGHTAELLAVNATLNTSATVATRFFRITVTDGAAFFTSPVVTVTASAGAAARGVAGASYLIFSSSTTMQQMLFATPGVLLHAGSTIATITTGIQSGDTITSVVYEVCDVDNTVTVTQASSVAGFGGDGLVVPVALGLTVFTSFAALIISFRHRRA